MEIQHLSHKHPLLQLECTTTQEGGRISCAGCRLDIDGPAFGCKECEFYLHEHCAQLLPELRHPLHPHGQLQLKLCEPYSRMWELYVCKICLDYITEPRFVYQCNRKCGSDECKRRGFLLHIDCAFLQPSLRHKYHKQHELVAYDGSGCLVNCAACGAEFDLCHGSDNAFHAARGAIFPFNDQPRDTIYRCLECDKQFHKECLDKLAQVKRVPRHSHDLTLYLKPIPEDYEKKDYYCDACEEMRNVCAFSYACIECDFICHIRCDFFKNIEAKRAERRERQLREKIKAKQKKLDQIVQKIKWLDEEKACYEDEKARYEESIKKHQEELSSISERRK